KDCVRQKAPPNSRVCGATPCGRANKAEEGFPGCCSLCPHRRGVYRCHRRIQRIHTECIATPHHGKICGIFHCCLLVRNEEGLSHTFLFFQVETVGIEPTQTACKAVSPPWHIRPHQVIPDGLEPSFPACDAGVVAPGPRDRASVAEVGIEPTTSSPGSRPGRF